MEKKKAPPVVSDINVTPMVDVMLVLLIIFMVITPMLTRASTVEMVKAKNPIAMQDADKEDAILVGDHARRQSCSEPGQQTDASRTILPNKVQDLLTNKLDKTVYIKADMRAKYERVEDVVDNLRAAGVDQIGLLTEQIAPQDRLRRRHRLAGERLVSKIVLRE